MKIFILLGFLTILILTMTSTQIANSTNQIQNVSNISNNLTNLTPSYFNHSEEIAAFASIFGKPFYELTSSNNIGSEVLSSNPPITKDSYTHKGFMQGIGNVTDQGTYVLTYSAKGYLSEGEGIIFSEDGQFITFTSTDTGFADGEGNFMYKGAIIFDSTEPVGIFSKLDNQIGLYITWSGNNGTNWSKTWLWE
jgi:hypothetical protein